MVERVYLDNNATTRPFPEVVDDMARCFRDCFGNPGSRHAHGRVARQALEDARESIAAILGAKPGEVVFTSGGTEATNTAIFGLAGSRPPGVILITAGEHPATMESCLQLQKLGWRNQTLEVDSAGRLLADQLDGLPWDTVVLVSVILAHNETGVIQDVHPLADRCNERGVPFHLDAVQAVGKLPVDFRELGVTSLALGAHKFHGPRGIGALLLREGTQLAPWQFGGHQEAGVRPGTELVALATGMATALKVWHAERVRRAEVNSALRDRLQQGLAETCAPVVVNGSREHRLPNTLNVSFPGVGGEALLVNFDLEGVSCSLGSTCASGSAEPAPALVAMGCPRDVCESAVRFSVSIENTAAEIDEAVRRIAAVVGRLRGE